MTLIGKFFDKTKGAYSEIPHLAMDYILKIRLFGKSKGYNNKAFENWKSEDQIKDAIFRHLHQSYFQENDSESGIDHIAHACFNCMIYLHNKKLKEIKKNDSQP
jgi:hypothetical protein